MNCERCKDTGVSGVGIDLGHRCTACNGESAKAGGEVEAQRYSVSRLRWPGGEIVCSVDAPVEVVAASDHDTHVTRLQADVKTWQESADAKHLKLVHTEIERDALKAEVERLKDKYQRDVYGLNNEGDPIGGDPAGGYANDLARMQSELYKARELLAEVVQGKGLSSDFDIKAKSILAHQSAPAAKDGE